MATCGTITVVPSFDPSAVTASCDAGGEVVVDEQTTITVTISNDNNSRASYSGQVLVNDSATGGFSGTVRGGGTVTESVALVFDSTGQKSISIDVDAEEA